MKFYAFSLHFALLPTAIGSVLETLRFLSCMRGSDGLTSRQLAKHKHFKDAVFNPGILYGYDCSYKFEGGHRRSAHINTNNATGMTSCDFDVVGPFTEADYNNLKQILEPFLVPDTWRLEFTPTGQQ